MCSLGANGAGKSKIQVSSEYEGKLCLKPDSARLTGRFPPNTEETCSAAGPKGTHGLWGA